ncbi:hypothetical protein GGR06_003503 [Bacteroides reticulotermitis]|uniref:Uncharacterized protein n=2 Tax=Bacteroides reticulotermitis TaxID=1133319 RepID=W4UVL8_9BACE|nr:hypothetical protein [Bacteroides reticulotermitis]MBB4045684.1 hypothetical protein [Bacteroides reticulotermitis]GAE84544.1 hypothetical protein JCM10512_2893 [Bacteroides reticulotermitis JCM 10512]
MTNFTNRETLPDDNRLELLPNSADWYEPEVLKGFTPLRTLINNFYINSAYC